ncbi:MAG: hypothetical protein EXS11_02850 [Gemmataceae bacterium]|nr:hypothetical protein [Gemmataceae bacterium]
MARHADIDARPVYRKAPRLSLHKEIHIETEICEPLAAKDSFYAIMGALDAHNLMSTQALNSDEVQQGILDILLNHAGLYEALRAKASPMAG